jgi:hypothetical protein
LGFLIVFNADGQFYRSFQVRPPFFLHYTGAKFFSGLFQDDEILLTMNSYVNGRKVEGFFRFPAEKGI